MKALKIILIIVVGIVGLAWIISLTAENTFRVERTVTIAAPVETVYGHVSSLAAMDKWSPWNEKDPSMKKSMEGIDGTIGAKASWEGNSDVGTGSQEITALEPNKRVETKLHFMEPMEATSMADVNLVAMGDSTKVTWGFSGTNEGMIHKVFSVLMNMDKMMGPDFEKGLGYLKEQVEKAQAETSKAPVFEITTIDRPAMLYIGKRGIVKWADMKEAYTKGFGEGMAALGKAKMQPVAPPSGVYFEWNEKDQTADMIAAIAVPAEAKDKLKGVDFYETPASKALVIDYMGGYSGMMAPHMAMDKYMKANNLTMNMNVVEEYVTDPMSEPDSTKWHTSIIYLVK